MATKNTRNKRYWKNCKVCTHIRKNADFRTALYNSSYYSEAAVESASQVLARYNPPFNQTNLYAHFNRHAPKAKASSLTTNLPTVIDGIPADILGSEFLEKNKNKEDFELGLDEIIKLGRDKLRRRELSISSQNLLVAIKTKADYVNKNKDQKLDLLKAFSGMVKDDSNSSTE